MAVFPLPRAPSRRAAGNRLDSSCEFARPCEMGAFSCFGVAVTAADRAAATCQRLSMIPVYKWRPEGVAGAIGKLPDGLRSPPRLRRGEILSASADAAPKRLPSQRELSCAKRMTEDTPLALSFPITAEERTSPPTTSHAKLAPPILPCPGRKTHLACGTLPTEPRKRQETAQLAEQPPLFGRGTGGGASGTEAASPGVLLLHKRRYFYALHYAAGRKKGQL